MKKTVLRFAIIAVVCAIPALLLGKIIWPPSPEIPMPTATELPFFMTIAAIEALTFGVGVAFLIFSWPIVTRTTALPRRIAVLAYISVGWQLVSWWPHDNLHMHIGMDLQRLLYLEYGFHLTLIITGVFLAYVVIRLLKRTVENPPRV